MSFDRPAPSSVVAIRNADGCFSFVLYVKGTKLTPAGSYATSGEALEHGNRRLREIDPEA